jgi:hypothetical protein
LHGLQQTCGDTAGKRLSAAVKTGKPIHNASLAVVWAL